MLDIMQAGMSKWVDILDVNCENKKFRRDETKLSSMLMLYWLGPAGFNKVDYQ